MADERRKLPTRTHVRESQTLYTTRIKIVSNNFEALKHVICSSNDDQPDNIEKKKHKKHKKTKTKTKNAKILHSVNKKKNG
jgi:hypothetical protein